MFKKLTAIAALLLMASATALAANTESSEVQCIIADKAADMSKSADYKDGKVYFCCGGCASKFAKTEAKYAVKANHQLVATKQYEQKMCPFSSRPADANKTTMVAGVKVAFCCDGCKSKVESTKDDDAKMALIFADKKFTKAFKKTATKK